MLLSQPHGTVPAVNNALARRVAAVLSDDRIARPRDHDEDQQPQGTQGDVVGSQV